MKSRDVVKILLLDSVPFVSPCLRLGMLRYGVESSPNSEIFAFFLSLVKLKKEYLSGKWIYSLVKLIDVPKDYSSGLCGFGLSRFGLEVSEIWGECPPPPSPIAYFAFFCGWGLLQKEYLSGECYYGLPKFMRLYSLVASVDGHYSLRI